MRLEALDRLGEPAMPTDTHTYGLFCPTCNVLIFFGLIYCCIIIRYTTLYTASHIILQYVSPPLVLCYYVALFCFVL